VQFGSKTVQKQCG